MATIRNPRDDLETFMDESVRLAAAQGYHPTIFVGMRQRHGTVETCRRLIVSGEIQSGFSHMVELGLMQWTVEAAIVWFHDKFSKAEREAAQWRLDQASRKHR
jgi:hypothetical protein